MKDFKPIEGLTIKEDRPGVITGIVKGYVMRKNRWHDSKEPRYSPWKLMETWNDWRKKAMDLDWSHIK